MATVDNRVVSMTFDNRSFAKNVSGTQKMLDRLRESLKFSGGKRGLEDLSDAAKKVDMSKMDGSIKNISAGFAAMATIGITTLANLTNKAVDAGVRMVKALALDPVIDGFKEYELNMNSIQTILANTESKGSTLQDVNGALDELNTYADKTIYNFAEMTRNIGTFTAAGVALDTSVRSIKGIANIAAVSGSSSQQASTAMYQLSQALATGTLKLMDWNSVVNAGMGGEVFQSSLFETGKALGTLTDVPVDMTFQEWKDAGNSFRESLESEWITADVLTTSLETFTGELSTAELAAKGFSDAQIVSIQKMADTATAAATEVKTATQLVSVIQEAIGSGWASTFRIVIGDFEEAKGLMSLIGNTITTQVDKITKSRNEMLESWKEQGGRDTVLQGLAAGISAIGLVLKPIKEAFREIFPKKSAEDLVALSDRFKKFAESLKIGGETAQKIKTVFRGVFSVFSIGIEIVKGIFGVFTTLVGAIFRVVGAFSFLYTGAGDALSGIRNFLVKSGGIEKFFDIIEKAINIAADAIVAFVDAIVSFASVVTPVFDLIRDGFSGAIDFIVEFVKAIFNEFGPIGEVFDDVKDKIGDFVDSITDRFSSIGDVFDDVKDKVGNFVDTITGFFEGSGPAAAGSAGGKGKGTWLDDVASYWGAGADGASNAFSFAVEKIKDAIDSLKESFSSLGNLGESAGKAVGNLGDLFAGFGDTISSAGEKVASFAANFKEKIAQAFGSDSYDSILEGVKVGLLGALTGILAYFAKEGLTINFGFFREIGDAIDGFTDTLEAMQLKLKAEALKEIAIAVGILVGSVIALSFIDGDKIKTSLAGMAAGLAGLVAALAALDKVGGSGFNATALAVSLGVMSVSLIAFAGAILVFSSLDPDEFSSGIIRASAALAALTAAAVALQYGTGGAIAAAVSMVVMAGALALMSKVIMLYADLNWIEMGRGIGFIAATLGVLVVAMNLMPVTGMVKAALAVGIFSFSLGKMVDVVKEFAKLSWDEMKQGLIGVAVSMGILVAVMAALSFLDTGKASIGMLAMAASLFVITLAIEKLAKLDMIGLGQAILALVLVLGALVIAALLVQSASLGVVGVIALAGALWIMAGVLKELGQLSLGQIGGALLAIVGVLLVLGLAAAALAAFPPLAAALIVMAGALLAIGLAFALAGVGAWLLADAFTKFSKVSDKSIDNIVRIIDKFVKKVPEWAKTFGEGLGEFIISVLEMGVKINEAFGKFLDSVLDLIIEKTPKITEMFGVIIEAAVELMRDKLPLLLDFAIEMILLFGEKIRDNMEDIVTLGAEIIAEFLQGMTNAVGIIGPKVIKLLQTIGAFISKHVGVLIDIAVDIIGSFIDGMADAVSTLSEKFVNLITEIGDAIIDVAGALIDTGVEVFGKLLEGMGDAAGAMAEDAEDLIEDVGDAIILVATALIDTGVEVFGKLLEGMGNAAGDMAEDAQEFINDIRDAIIAVASTVGQAGQSILTALIKGTITSITKVSRLFKALALTIGWEVTSQIKIWGAVGIAILKTLLQEGAKRIREAVNAFGIFVLSILKGIYEAILRFSTPIGLAGQAIAYEIIKGIIKGFGLPFVTYALKRAVTDLANKLPWWMRKVLRIRSPSKVFMDLATNIPAGIALALNKDTLAQEAAGDLATRTTKTFQKTMKKLPTAFEGVADLNPTIAPVLDLTNVKKEAKTLGSILDSAPITTDVSLSNAKVISASANNRNASTSAEGSGAGNTYVQFEQNNYSPKALSTNEIYKKTRGQIEMAKEKLSIP